MRDAASGEKASKLGVCQQLLRVLCHAVEIVLRQVFFRRKGHLSASQTTLGGVCHVGNCYRLRRMFSRRHKIQQGTVSASDSAQLSKHLQRPRPWRSAVHARFCDGCVRQGQLPAAAAGSRAPFGNGLEAGAGECTTQPHAQTGPRQRPPLQGCATRQGGAATTVTSCHPHPLPALGTPVGPRVIPSQQQCM